MSELLPMCVDLRVRAGSKKWREVRQTGIGASEIAFALGIGNPNWGSPYELYARKRGELPDDIDNAQMEWGRNLEEAIIKRFLKCHPEFRDGPCLTGKLYRSRIREWQLATPDAVVFDARYGFHHDRDRPKRTSHGYPVIVQAKTGHRYEGWGQEGTDDIPVYYRAQVLHEMDVTGARLAWVPVLFNGREYREYRVEWHERDVEILRIRGEEFWRRIREGNPPPVDGAPATTRALKDTTFEPDKQVQVDRSLMDKLARAYRLEKRLDDYIGTLENRLRQALGDAQVAMVGTEPAARRLTYTQRRIETTRLRNEQPEIAAEYTTPREVNRLTTYTKEFGK